MGGATIKANLRCLPFRWRGHVGRASFAHVKSPLTFFIAGAIQGSRQSTIGMNQEYRAALQKTITGHISDATVVCPLALLMERFAGRLEQAVSAYEQETTGENLDAQAYGPIVSEIRAAFCELTEIAARSDVLIAYLPDHEASMGTAMEMWSAYSHGRPVIAITSMTKNLSIIATSDIVLPSIEAFEAFLAAGGLRDLLDHRASRA